LLADDLKEHRQRVVATDRSLPQRAGRAFKKLEAAYAMHTLAAQQRALAHVMVETAKTKRQSKDRIIRVTSLVHAESDVIRMAKALLALAGELQAAEHKKKHPADVEIDQQSAA